MTLSVVPFPEQPKADIPEILRKLADGIEDGTFERPSAMAYVFDTEDDLQVGLVGLTSEIHAFWMLSQGARYLLRDTAE